MAWLPRTTLVEVRVLDHGTASSVRQARFLSMATVHLTLAQLYLKAQNKPEKSLRYSVQRSRYTVSSFLGATVSSRESS